MQITHRITIEPISQGARGERYRVSYAGAVLIESCRDPEFDACRALRAQGITGTAGDLAEGRILPRNDPRH